MVLLTGICLPVEAVCLFLIGSCVAMDFLVSPDDEWCCCNIHPCGFEVNGILHPWCIVIESRSVEEVRFYAISLFTIFAPPLTVWLVRLCSVSE